MSTTNPPFSPGEWSCLATLLALVAEQFSYKSCTDYPLGATTDNKALACAAIECAGLSGNWDDEDASWEDYAAAVMAEDEQIVTFMDWMAAHLAVRCQALAAGTGEPLNGAARAAVAQLLCVAREDHDEAEAMGLVPHAIESGDENRAVLAQVVPEDARAPGQASSVPFKALLIYFAQRVALI